MEKLSSDEQYLFDVANAVSSGKCSEALANKLPGTLSHARWITKASRCLRLYMGTVEPSIKLIDIVTYIINVYVPTYFNVKVEKSCVSGSKHFFNLIKYSKSLPEKHFEIIVKVCRNNFYYGHPENIMLAMIFDDDRDTRIMAYHKILNCRNISQERNDEIVREYVAPKFHLDNIASKKYYDIIDWNRNITEPPFTLKMSNDQIRHYCITGTSLQF